ncbi:unnamed protein product [Parascedosporium putredinis]|uniref:Acetylxylan esterase n=1 Tax=Parascedosporium putredinis TaxID=1442378 RepID=A0A9P1H5B8_9PEZI|nr:unnamed protein product [Parascedosporium putredinis]CAI7996311.1 unnamed protein product [Parascedosporium putredinis]
MSVTGIVPSPILLPRVGDPKREQCTVRRCSVDLDAEGKPLTRGVIAGTGLGGSSAPSYEKITLGIFWMAGDGIGVHRSTMHVKSLLALGSLAALTSAAAVCTAKPCTDVRIFLVRGTTEPYPGRQKAIAQAICAEFDSCDFENVQYPASYNTYCASAAAGVSATVAAVQRYGQRCPNSKIVLSGWSQGAHVVGDALGGAAEMEWIWNSCTQPVIAALMWGSPRHNNGQVYNLLSGQEVNGLGPRNTTELANLNKYSDALRDYSSSQNKQLGSKLKPCLLLPHSGDTMCGVS